MFDRWRHYLRETFISLGRGGITSISAVVIIAITLLVAGLFLMVEYNVEQLVAKAKSQVEVQVYLKDDTLQPATIDGIKQQLLRIPGVKEAEFHSKEEALAEYKELYDPAPLTELPENPLPASFLVRLTEDKRTSSAIAEISKVAAAIPGVEEVTYGKEWIENLESLTMRLRQAGLVIAVFLALASILVVSNTIKLTVIARREQIAILKVVGASDSFVRMPFVLEGAIYGIGGAGLSLLLLWGGYRALLNDLPDMVFLPSNYIMGMLVFGLILGMLGSVFSIRRFLKV
jgi:cell division transport system permease protein